jgi:glycosyltransferase involved in cell wall biosynthesis
MRILICIPHDLTSPRGNSIAALRLKKGFENRGHQVSVLENCEARDAGPVAAFAQAVGPDVVVIMHAWRCAAACRDVLTPGGFPVIVSLRGTDINEMIEDEKRGPVIRSVLDACQGVTVFSDTIRHRVLDHVPLSRQKVWVIPNGLHLPASSVNYRRRLGIRREAFVAVGLAGIRHEKRLLWLLDMLAKLKAKNNDLLYLHAGPVLDGEKGKTFQNLCAGEPWIRYAGVIPHEEAASFLKAGDIFLSASRSEGMPHAVREAMFVGLPCLLSDIESHRNMARDGVDALLFQDERSFVTKATLLMQDRELRRVIARNGRTRAREDLLRSAEIDSYLALFANLTGVNS